MNYYSDELNRLDITGPVGITLNDFYGHKTKHMDLNTESIEALREFLTKYKESQKVKITLNKTDWKLLSDQKQTLLETLEGKADPTYELNKSHLQGLVHFLDHVQDQAVEAGVPEKTVFPNLGE
jgi:flagellar basal body P-ring protein FlgI